MARIPNVRVGVPVRFPSQVVGTGPITLVKQNGVWSIGLDFTRITNLMPVPADYPNSYFLYYSDSTKAYYNVSLAQMAVGLGIGQVVQVITDATNPVVVQPTTNLVILNRAAPLATTISLPSVAARGGLSLDVFDYAGNSGDMTFVPNGAEKIMNVAQWVVGSGGVAGSGGRLRLIPSTDVGGWCV